MNHSEPVFGLARKESPSQIDTGIINSVISRYDPLNTSVGSDSDNLRFVTLRLILSDKSQARPISLKELQKLRLETKDLLAQQIYGIEDQQAILKFMLESWKKSVLTYKVKKSAERITKQLKADLPISSLIDIKFAIHQLATVLPEWNDYLIDKIGPAFNKSAYNCDRTAIAINLIRDEYLQIKRIWEF